jgi:hypothetical protein
MKKLFKVSGLILSLTFLMLSAISFGQAKFELSPFGGYMFGGKIAFYEGDLKIKDNGNYGLALDIRLASDTQIELMWTQMATTGEFIPYFGYDYLALQQFDVTVGYIQIGSVREFDMDKVKPFGVFTLGTTYFMPKDATFNEGSYFTETTTLEDSWKFSVTLGAGAKIWLSDRVGIRLQGNLMLPMFWGGAGFTVGTGGAGFTVGAGTSMVQGDFTGGLIFALGD